MNRLILAAIFLMTAYCGFAQPVWRRDTICKNTQVKYTYIITINGNKPSLWEWTLNGANPSTYSSASDSATPFFSFPDTGTFSIVTKLSYTTGFDTTVQAIITVFDPAPPSGSLGNDTTYCGSFSRMLNAGNTGSTYLWSPGNQTTQKITVTQPGTYSVAVSNKCYSGTFTINLSQTALPNVNLGEDGFTCNTDTFLLNAGNPGSTYLWTPGGYTGQYLVVTSSGTYSVQVTNSAGCTSGDEVVYRDSCPPDLLVPTAFTPNRDEHNDKLVPYTNGIRTIKFSVYNRWGEQMYYTDKVGDGWDGTFEGVAAMSGLYIWTINAIDNNGYRHVERGYFILIR